MSTIQSSSDHVIINADGSSKDIKFQANGVEKASISSSGAFTSTTIDATKLTGTIPNFTSTGIDDNADATAITIGLDERVAIKATTPKADLHLKAHNNGWTGGMLVEHNSGDKGWHIHPENNSENGLWFGYRADTTSAIGSESVATHLQLTSDGRGKSQFTAKAWVNFNGSGTVTIRQSHNVSSVTDGGVGRYDVNFSNNLADASFAATMVIENNQNQQWIASYSTSSYRINVYTGSAYVDDSQIGSIVFGN